MLGEAVDQSYVNLSPAEDYWPITGADDVMVSKSNYTEQPSRDGNQKIPSHGCQGVWVKVKESSLSVASRLFVA